MFNYLTDEIKKMKANVISIGIDNKLIKSLTQNDNINVYNINKNNNTIGFRRKKRTTSSGKNINIKKLSKYFKKKSIDYILCDYEQIMMYYKHIFRDSIYLNKEKIYFYAKDNIDIDYINKYKRYNSKIIIKKFKDYNVVIIHNNQAKTNKFKNICFFIVDTVSNLLDFISNTLTG